MKEPRKPQGAARDGQRWNQPRQRAVYLGITAEITLPLNPLHPAMAQVALVHQVSGVLAGR